MSYSKILIANRGEIACRVIRTARRLGYQTVAVFSDADRDAPHVALADEAVHIGPSAAADSYLNGPALLEAARKTLADAVHPGYGFLSENAAFAQEVLDAGLVFIGPPPHAMRAMGDKALAKRRMQEAGVPCAPGYLGADQSDAALQQAAQELGLPLLVKAVAGGGGRGMRLVRAMADLQAAIDGARREALSAFGNDTLMLERLIENARHIEIQVFSDAHGNAVHLGERDCTAQRRRQKVIEEAPSVIVSAAMRAAMGRDAVAAALAVGYRGAGTVEFIVDDQLRHYFLEMNTRLQVEHPVTEMVTGLDLVEWQLREAAEEPLPLRQEDIQLQGHAIEARLYAEDPYANFAPQTGNVLWWQPEAARRDGARIDDGIVQGDTVSPYYDPMVAKFIVHGHDRDDAIRRLRAALTRAPLLGIKNNGRFLGDLLDHPAFRDSTMTTGTLDQWQEAQHTLFQAPQPCRSTWCLAAAALAMHSALTRQAPHWRADSVAAYGLTLQCDGQSKSLRVCPGANGVVDVVLDGAQEQLHLLALDGGHLRYCVHGVHKQALVVLEGAQLHLAVDGCAFVFAEQSPYPQTDTLQDPRRITAPVAGKVVQVLVHPGQAVRKGDALLCIEAMKMEIWLNARAPGVVSAIQPAVGTQVESGQVLVQMDLTSSEDS